MTNVLLWKRQIDSLWSFFYKSLIMRFAVSLTLYLSTCLIYIDLPLLLHSSVCLLDARASCDGVT